jgi:hypothetical protein
MRALIDGAAGDGSRLVADPQVMVACSVFRFDDSAVSRISSDVMVA